MKRLVVFGMLVALSNLSNAADLKPYWFVDEFGRIQPL